MAEKWASNDLELLKSVYMDYTNEELVELYFQNRTTRAVETIASKYKFSGKSEETMKRVNAIKGEKTAKKIKGIKRSDETKIKISEIKKEYFKTHSVGDHLLHPTKETRKKMSIAKKSIGQWKGKTNPRAIHPLCGSENGKSNGGTTGLIQELRSEIVNWKNLSMQLCNYKCIVTNNDFQDIHHLAPFIDLVNMSFEITKLDKREKVNDYSEAEFNLLKMTLINLHDENILGICLDKKIHKLFHDYYNYTNNIPCQFLDFVYRLDVGEFDNWLQENNLQLNINYQVIDYIESSLLLQQTA